MTKPSSVKGLRTDGGKRIFGEEFFSFAEKRRERKRVEGLKKEGSTGRFVCRYWQIPRVVEKVPLQERNFSPALSISEGAL